MPTTTSRLTLQQPIGTDAASEYRTAITNNAGILDAAALYLEGTLTGRPAAAVKGRIYRATDDTTGGPNGTLYFDTGAAWNLLPTDAKGVVEPAFSNWKPILFGSTTNVASTTNTVLEVPGYYFDPAQYAAGSRTVKIRVRHIIGANIVFGGGYTITSFLAPVTVTRGGTGQGNLYSVGAAVASVATAPAAGLTHGEGSAVAAPAAGFYALGVVTTANDSNAFYDAKVILEVQQT